VHGNIGTVSSKLDGALAALSARQMVEEMVEQQVEQMSGQLQQVLQQSMGVTSELGRMDGMLHSAQQWEEEFNSKLHALNQVQIQDQSDLADMSRELSALRNLEDQVQGQISEALSGLDRKLRTDNQNLKADLQASCDELEREAPEASQNSPAVCGAPAAGAGAGTDGQEEQLEGRRKHKSVFVHTYPADVRQGTLARANSVTVALGDEREEQSLPTSGDQEDTDGGGLAEVLRKMDRKIDSGLMRVDGAIVGVRMKVGDVENGLNTLKHQLRNI